MAAGIIAKPGSENGPCIEECKHLDCEDARSMADTLCLICKHPIGYETRFFQKEHWENLTHELCELKQIEKEHKLIIKCLHDAQAECSACGWSFVGTGERTREYIEAEFNKHLI